MKLIFALVAFAFVSPSYAAQVICKEGEPNDYSGFFLVADNVPESFLGNDPTHHLQVAGFMQLAAGQSEDGRKVSEPAAGALGWSSGKMFFAMKGVRSLQFVTVRAGLWNSRGVSEAQVEVGTRRFTAVCSFH